MANCSKCGSGPMMDRLRVWAGGESLPNITLVAYGDPDAILFKESAYSPLEAAVCGGCGYTELFARDPRALVQAVAQAKKRSRRK